MYYNQSAIVYVIYLLGWGGGGVILCTVIFFQWFKFTFKNEQSWTFFILIVERSKKEKEKISMKVNENMVGQGPCKCFDGPSSEIDGPVPWTSANLNPCFLPLPAKTSI